MASGKADGGEGGSPKGDTKRSRWATRKMTVKSGALKRLSLAGKSASAKPSPEEKRSSGGSDSLHKGHAGEPIPDADGPNDGNPDDEASTQPPRKIYFNLPLPRHMTDEEGHPNVQYTRNKIRTAKYTPLSFVPKNLWYQFHNIANIFFLFIDILVASLFTPFLPLPLRPFFSLSC